MRIAVVSQGPSAGLYAGNESGVYNLTIGVNWTVNRWPFDWWVFVDQGTPAKCEGVLGKPVAFCGSQALAKMARNDTARMAWLVDHTQRIDCFNCSPRLGYPWARWSGTAALWLAIRLGETCGEEYAIDLYGFDMGGAIDFTGESGNSRSEARWTAERAVYAELVATAVNGNVARILPVAT